jgi:uncharacterized protein YbbK (DUF523 family)/uncharacterized protein YbgA (DUF1722 family)
MSEPTITLGISACLLGEQCRWDGGNQRDPLFTDQLGRFVRFISVCPEVEMGFGVPREPCRLMGDPLAPRIVTRRTAEDHTQRLLRWCRRRIKELKGEALDGFILKEKSPSCGLERAAIYDARGVPRAAGPGLFARAVMARFPLIPLATDSRLHDPLLLAGFIERVSVMQRWRETARQTRSRGALVRFHAEHELVLLSHSPRHYRLMGGLVALAKVMPLAALNAQYEQALVEALLLKSTPAKHARCLRHILSDCKKNLPPEAKQELQAIIAAYRQGHCHLSTPLTRINHYVSLFGQPYLIAQHYLRPHPVQQWAEDLT